MKITITKPKYRIYYNRPDEQRILEEHYTIHHYRPFPNPVLPPKVPKPKATI